jgi:hypothetical protein
MSMTILDLNPRLDAARRKRAAESITTLIFPGQSYQLLSAGLRFSMVPMALHWAFFEEAARFAHEILGGSATAAPTGAGADMDAGA